MVGFRPAPARAADPEADRNGAPQPRRDGPPPGVAWGRAVWTVLRKDLLLEFRAPEALTAMGLFGLLVSVVFSFAFDPGAQDLRPVFAGLLWTAFLFAGLLGMGRSFSRERESEALSGLLLAPVDPSAVFYGKCLANLTFMLAAEAVLLLPFFALLSVPFAGDPLAFGGSVVLATAGVAAVGTLVSALAARARAAEVLMPLLALPVLAPVLIGAVRLGQALVAGPLPAQLRPWFWLLGAYDALFWFLPLGVFEYVVED
jgi:heme exporter protein B